MKCILSAPLMPVALAHCKKAKVYVIISAYAAISGNYM